MNKPFITIFVSIRESVRDFIFTYLSDNAMKELKMFINGQFVQNKSGKWIDVLNPATEKVICRQPDGTAEDAAVAVEAAEKAQEIGKRRLLSNGLFT
jgi:hypothetical protein